MEVKQLTTIRKKLNAVFLISIILSILPWLLIFPIFSFYNEKSTLAAILMMVSFIAIVVSICIGLIRVFSQSKITVKKHGGYVLYINSIVEPENIEKAHQIAYAKNYLKHPTLNVSIEITNKEAFTLLKNKPLQNLKTIVMHQKTSFFEQNPLELFQSLMSMADAAS